VRDNGNGLDPELMPRLFDLFMQGKQPIDRQKGGLGLGLAIARNIVEMHGGELRAASDGPGRGSEFTLELPLVAARDEAVPEPAPGPTPEAPAVGRRVLIVDDNTDAADLIADALQSLGHLTKVAYDGPSALQAAPEFRPELALLDIGLPVMDGYELGRRLSNVPGCEQVKLVALTGYGQTTDRERSREAGFDEHLVKPIDLERILNVIDRL
jgi:CheY-like chemotaxis protein